MDYRRERGLPSDNVVHILSGNGANENWGANEANQPIWATGDEYGIWNNETAYDMRATQSRSGSETPSKRPKISQSSDLTGPNHSKAIGKMFYKTKLCCKFRVGTCPYVTNCNFAHNIEELRKPPPNWEEIVAAHDEDKGFSSEPREEYQIPILGVIEEPQRNYKGRHCKKFYTLEGCPYGENCTFLHDEQSKTRESVAISLGPGSGAGYGSTSANANGVALKSSNWKTRICNKWELTGYCPFGTKCHFAHGAAELHSYGGGPLDSEIKDSSTLEGGAFPAKASVDTVIVPMITAVPHSDNYHMAPPNTGQSTGRKPNQKWKGPNKISKIYGDWIDDL